MANIPASAVCYFRQDDKWVCVLGDFIDFESSPYGIADSFFDAFDELTKKVRGEVTNA